MIGKLDKEIIDKFKEFQRKTGKYGDLSIENIEFEKVKASKSNEYFTINNGQRLKKSDLEQNKDNLKEPIEVYSATEFDEEIFGYIEKEKLKNISPNQKIYKNKTILLNTGGSVGAIRFKNKPYEYTVIDNVIVYVVNEEIFNIEYLYYSLKGIMKNNSFNYSNTLRGKDLEKANLVIAIPKDLNKFYSSYQIQEVIVDFLEFWKEGYTDNVRKSISKKKPIYKKIKELIVKNTFKYDEFIVENFNKFAKEKGYNFNFKDIEFERKYLKGLVSMPIKGGGTPDTKVNEYWHSDFSLVDNVNYFGWRNIEKKLFNNKIISEYSKVISKKGFESCSTWLVPKNSILIAIASASKGLITINDKPMCTNQNILGVVINKQNNKEYIYYFLENTYKYLDGKKEFGNLTKGSEENREILLPNTLNDYSSKEIQFLLVEFWEMIIEQIDKKLIKYCKMLELANTIDKAFLFRTFSKIDWSKE